MQTCLAEWQTITSDPFILQCVTNCEIEFDYIPRPSSSICCLHPEHKFSLQEQHAIDVEIGKFLEKQIIELTEAEPEQIVSPIFLTPKKEPGTFRVIFNLKHLNQSVTYRKFKMDTLESAIKLMKPGCYMTCVDLQDAYYSIPMSPLFRKYLKFAWRGRLYQFRALPMGLISSPRIFTKVLKPVFATLRSQYGHHCTGYIDDSFYTEDTDDHCQDSTLHAVELLTKLGFVVHPTKSSLIPTQELEFLGFLLNSISMTVCLTPKKISKLIAMCEKYSRLRAFTIREIASLIGTLVGTFPGVELGPLYYRNLEYDKDAALRSACGNYEHTMWLSADSRSDLQWWVAALPTAVRYIDHGNPDVILTTDASHTGWGATTGKRHTQGL